MHNQRGKTVAILCRHEDRPHSVGGLTQDQQTFPRGTTPHFPSSTQDIVQRHKHPMRTVRNIGEQFDELAVREDMVHSMNVAVVAVF